MLHFGLKILKRVCWVAKLFLFCAFTRSLIFIFEYLLGGLLQYFILLLFVRVNSIIYGPFHTTLLTSLAQLNLRIYHVWISFIWLLLGYLDLNCRLACSLITLTPNLAIVVLLWVLELVSLFLIQLSISWRKRFY